MKPFKGKITLKIIEELDRRINDEPGKVRSDVWPWPQNPTAPAKVWVVSYVGIDEEWISKVFRSKEKAEEFVASKDDSNFWRAQGWVVEE